MQFTSILRSLTLHPDRHIKSHATALLKRLQEITDDLEEDVIKLNPQDHT